MSTAAASNLNGNWLLAGVLPTQTSLARTSFGLAMSFSVQGTEVFGSGTAQFTCGGTYGGLSFASLVEGTIAADGTFTAQAPSALGVDPAINLVVTGSVPKTPGGAWSGTYSLQLSPSAPAGACSFFQQGVVTAAPIANVAGKYVGSGTLEGGLGQASVPVTVTVNLQQGGDVVSAMGVTAYDALLLRGTVQVAGTSCFSSGSIASLTGTSLIVGGGVEGNRLIATFNMDDGSRLVLGGNMADLAATRIVGSALLDTGGGRAVGPVCWCCV